MVAASKLGGRYESVRAEACTMMEGATHRMVRTNGIDMHIVEQGKGPLVLLLHGFPEISYSWRYQLPALAAAGFHAVAPDIRGCGQTEAPESAANYTSMDIVGDLAGLVEALGEKEVLLIGHDWGARHAWDLCLLRPDLVKAVVALSVPFEPRKSSGSILSQYRAVLHENFYMFRFQKPGLTESDYERCGVSNALRQIFTYSGSDKPLQSPLSEAELAVYSKNFSRTGWTGALNAYRAMDMSWKLKAPWTDCGVDMPALFMVGDHDAVYQFPGMREFIHNGDFHKFVPNLKDVIILEDSHHFIQQQRHEIVSQTIINFFQDQLAAAAAAPARTTTTR